LADMGSHLAVYVNKFNEEFHMEFTLVSVTNLASIT
jgi:hypothetical protein